MRIAWFSQLPLGATPADSVSAYVTALLLPYLKAKYEIELFHDDFSRYQDYPTFHYLSAFERHERNPYDIFFYQVEDLPSANFARMALGLAPGIVLFHNVVFTTPAPEGLAHSGWQETVAAFLGLEPPATGKDLDESPFDHRSTALALLPVFSSEWSHHEFRRETKSFCGQRANLDPASDFLAMPIDEIAPVAGAGERPPLIGFCGSPRIESRAHNILQALALGGSGLSLIWLLGPKELAHAENLCEEFGIRHVEFVLGRSPAKWLEVTRRIRCAVHTQFSVFGNLAPYLQTSLMAQLPCAVMRFGAAEYLPDRAVCKIEPGENEIDQISSFFSEQGRASAVNEVGRTFAEEFHLTARVASELSAIFEKSRKLAPVMREWEQSAAARRRAVADNLRSEFLALGIPDERILGALEDLK